MAGPVTDLARAIDLLDSASITSHVLRRAGRGMSVNTCAAPPAVESLGRSLATSARRTGARVLPAEFLVVGNSAYPRDWHDGLLWAGRGFNLAVTAGAQIGWGPFTAALAPVIAFQSNADHAIRPWVDSAGSLYRHPWYGNTLDAPSRFGDRPFASMDPGRSFVRVDGAGFALGLSHEGIGWGPARRNPLVLSGTAPGFAHAFFETARPIDVWIGRIDAQLFWGRLHESDFFDDNPRNDRRLLAGLLFALQPAFMDGLTVGGGRTQSFTWWPELSLGEVMLRPYRGISENPQGLDTGDNQIITLFFRWAAAPYGIEAYGEWAREDHWEGWTGLLRNLDSSQAYTLGLQKVIRRDDVALRVAAEITHLADALPVLFASRGLIPFYSNTSVVQGHTHRGQMLGAPIGTGAEAQWIGADLFWREGRSTMSVERARYEDDSYYVNFAPVFGAHARDAEWTVRGGHMTTFGNLSLDAEIGVSTRYNRGFLGLDSIAPGEAYRRETNLSLRLGGRYTPGSALLGSDSDH